MMMWVFGRRMFHYIDYIIHERYYNHDQETGYYYKRYYALNIIA